MGLRKCLQEGRERIKQQFRHSQASILYVLVCACDGQVGSPDFLDRRVWGEHS